LTSEDRGRERVAWRNEDKIRLPTQIDIEIEDSPL